MSGAGAGSVTAGASEAAVAGLLPVVMGVLNVTPDSFSDGGNYLAPEAAVARAEQMLAQGAHIIDVGGESTRPGATPVSPQEEQRRVLTVVRELVQRGAVVSVDTIHASTAAAAVEAGASYINDVSGGLHDPEMLRVAARASRERGVGFIIGHWRGVPDPQHSRSNYADVVGEVREALRQLAEAAEAAGALREHIVLDPGLGFDKTAEQSWALLAACGSIAELGYPVLIGTSRKRMLGEALEGSPPAARAADVVGHADVAAGASGWHERDLATAVTSVHAALAGAWGVRVHNVAATVQALAVHGAYMRAAIGAAGVTLCECVSERECRCECGDEESAAAPASNTIHIRGLEFYAHHGVYEHEKQNGQPFSLDLTIDTVPPLPGSDDLAQTLDYGTLADEVLAAVTAESFDLLERVAERALEVVLAHPVVLEASVTVHKPEAPLPHKFADVAVTRRARSGQLPGSRA